MLFDEAVDGSLKIHDGVEGAVFQASPGRFGKETLSSVEPRAGCGDEVESPEWMPGQPGADFGLLVGCVIVEDDVRIRIKGFSYRLQKGAPLSSVLIIRKHAQVQVLVLCPVSKFRSES